MSYQLIEASASAIPLADEIVQTCVTSPPYWGLREYAGESGVRWRDGTVHPLGLEPTPELYVEHMVEVFREVKRVLRPDGTLWCNLGDAYAHASSGGGGAVDVRTDGRNTTPGDRVRGRMGGVNTLSGGLKPKDLVGIPWRVAFALQADGWYLRSDIIWSKPNPMPESVTDRPTKAHEYIFLLSKSPRYYFDADAVREPAGENTHARGDGVGPKNAGTPSGEGIKHNEDYARAINGLVTSRNIRTVWDIATQPYSGAHFATFPEAIPERCIKAGSAPGDVVLDPFNGSGTTGRVAQRLSRDYVGLDTSREYLEMALERVDPIQAAHRDARAGTSDQQVMSL
jgi:DNA modification methylase